VTGRGTLSQDARMGKNQVPAQIGQATEFIMSSDTSPSARLATIRTQLKDAFAEREAVVDGLLTALIGRSHIFLLGPPGTGKSALINTVVAALVGATSFKWLMTKFSEPGELFGPLDLMALKQGRQERITTGKLPSAHVAYLDECFKANSAILNSFLTLMEERCFDNGTTRLDCPLESMIGSSNELPEGPELGALYDRFTFRFFVDYIQNQDKLRKVMLGGAPAITASITLDELHDLQAQAAAMPVPDAVLDAIIAIKVDLEGQGVVVSDRSWVNMVNVVRARAVVEGSATVETRHLEAMADCCWQEPDQRSLVASLVGQRANPAAAEAVENMDCAEEALATYPEEVEDDNVAAATRLRRQVKRILDETQTLLNGSPSTRVTDCVARITAIKREMDRRFTAYAGV
jgi:MoxR-like ATPase